MSDKNLTLIETMLNLQDNFNKKLNDDWRNANWKWDYALMQEYSEAFNYIPWKWWKHETLDKNQLIMEMVDIYHFGMSHMMQYDSKNNVMDSLFQAYDDTTVIEHSLDMDGLYDQYLKENKGSDHTLPSDGFNNFLLKFLIAESINDITDDASPFFNHYTFFEIWNLLGLSLEDLYKKYIGKNVLNIFRQNHGYKDGSYIKIWNGLEDNEVLTSLLNDLDCDEHLFDNVYKQLESSYQTIGA